MPQDLISAPLGKDQAHALVDAVMDRELALSASAHEDEDTGEWIFEATCDSPPDLSAFSALARDVLGGEVGFSVAALDEATDWVARSLEGLRPVVAGGFYIHGSHETQPPPRGLVPILIDAAQAFGTGHHETTTGCLIAIDRLLRRRRPLRPLDLGTGTGVLAIAIAKRRHVPVVASDIDPVAVATARANAARNGVSNAIVPIEAVGLAHPRIRDNAPYDLVVANILAAPLVSLAPGISRIIDRGGTVILSGLLASQAARVIAAYRIQGLFLRERILRKDWATLVLERDQEKLQTFPVRSRDRTRTWGRIPIQRNGIRP